MKSVKETSIPIILTCLWVLIREPEDFTYEKYQKWPKVEKQITKITEAR